MKLDDLMIRAYMEGFSGASIYCDEEKLWGMIFLFVIDSIE